MNTCQCKYMMLHTQYMQYTLIRKYKPNTEYIPNTNSILTEYVPGMYWVCIGALIQTQYCNTYQYVPGKPMIMIGYTWGIQYVW